MTWLLCIPVLVMAQRRPQQQAENSFHEYEFWKKQPSLELVKQKIKEGNDPVKQNKAAFDALSYAIMTKNSIETIDYLLSLPGNDVNKSTHDNRSYLMWAGYAGDLQTMKLLLSKGADTKVVGSHGFNWYTFTLNAGHENTNIYELMVANGVDLKETNRNGANAVLLLAQNSKDGKIIDYFVNKGLNEKVLDANGNSLLFYAAYKGNIALLKKYIAKGFDYKRVNNDGENLVLAASHGGRGGYNSKEVFEYLASLNLKMDQVNHKGQTALHLLARGSKDKDLISFFMEHGVDVTKKDKEGNTAFLNAVSGNNSAVVKLLLPKVKDINQQNNSGYTALTLATQRGNLDLFHLLTKNGADVNIIDKEGNNLFYHLFEGYNRRSAKNFKPFAQALKKVGVSFTKASQNEPPLHIAIAKGDLKLIQTAFELGANVHQKNAEGLTPLHLAAMKAKSPRLLQLLLKKGANKANETEFGETAYDLAKENEMLKKQNIEFLKP